MKKCADYIVALFDSLVEKLVGPSIKIPTEESYLAAVKKNVRLTVASRASGNALLQQGLYTTHKDIEVLRAENRRYVYKRAK